VREALKELGIRDSALGCFTETELGNLFKAGFVDAQFYTAGNEDQLKRCLRATPYGLVHDRIAGGACNRACVHSFCFHAVSHGAAQ
jgi:hypothetical protein